MKAIIMAAGRGVRMMPLTETVPKPLLKVGGKPLLEHIISRLPEEVDEIIVVIGYLGQQIKDYFGDEYLGRRLQYVWQDEPRGTHYALKLCQPLLAEGERYFALYADDIHGMAGLRECLEYPRAMLVTEVEDPRRFGVARLNEDGSVAELVEKPEQPASHTVSTGAFLLDTEIFNFEPERHRTGEFFLSSSIAKMVEAGHEVFAVRSSLWLPVGFPEDLARVEKELRQYGPHD